MALLEISIHKLQHMSKKIYLLSSSGELEEKRLSRIKKAMNMKKK